MNHVPEGAFAATACNIILSKNSSQHVAFQKMQKKPMIEVLKIL
jgi:hypothetical protein